MIAAASRPVVEPLEPQQVSEQVGDQPFEYVERRECVLAHGEQEGHRQVGHRQRASDLACERAFVGAVTVVEEVLLHLVEHDVERSVEAVGRLGQRLGERRVRVGPNGSPVSRATSPATAAATAARGSPGQSAK